MCPFAVLLAACLAEPYSVPEPRPVESPLLVGCYYFPGHFNAHRWAPMAEAGFPCPLLGWYRDGEPEVSDWHIKWAVEHGIDFFAFDWYYDYKSGRVHEHNAALERGFLHARYRDRMRFCIFWCNEETGEPDYTEEQMLLLARTLRDHYFGQPNYLRLTSGHGQDARATPVVFVSQPQRLIKRFGVEGCAAIWSKVAAEAGSPLLLVAEQHSDQATLKQAGFNACAAYNYAGVNVAPGAKEAPYDTMVTGYETLWQEATKPGILPYIVPVSPGWDSRPWYGDRAMVRTDPRPEKFRRMCEAAKRYVNPKLQAVIAECWNEFGEGSYLEPTVQYGFGYLDALRDAFCPANPHHLDLTPQSLGRTAPVYDEIPILTAADIAGQDGNLLYNPGFEMRWGWVTFFEVDTKLDETVAHSGRRSAVITPDEGGMKSLWHVDVKPGEKLEIWAWVRTEPGATAEVKCALFGPTGVWLRRYLELGSASGAEWQRVGKTLTWEDAEAGQIDLEVAPRGERVWVDEVGIRK
ncbi:MAG: glycoside hydrolase family 99-like domain-containing protein [Armatimonadetes bacterium]|nr:glycoside hydrolase family 99-like domain-containing protein [Armatimonadota bacterium]